MTTLTSSANPAIAGQSITFTATVAGVGSNTPVPTGTVTFFDGSTTLGTNPLNGSAQVALATSTLAAGSHSITAVYSADTNYAASTSTVLTQVVNVPAKVSTATIVSSSANPATASQSVVFTATATGVGSNSPIPTGAVTFLDGTTTLGTTSLDSAGSATFTTMTLAVGTHQITAQYAGDTIYLGSNSSILSQTINTAPNFTIGFNPTTLTVTHGQSGTVAITATPVGGFSQSIALACSGLPLYTTCTFNPATITPAAGNSPATSTLTIATNVGVASNDSRPYGRPADGRIWSAGLMLGLGFLATRKMRRRLVGATRTGVLLLIFGLLGVMVATQLSGCGGGGASSTKQTPAGSSTITVTATSGSQVQTGSFTLTVQ
jgi:hypothetical protein